LLLDHDDTLLRTIRAKWAHHKHVAKTFYDKELTDVEIKRHWGKPFEKLLCLLYGTGDVQEAIAYNTATRNAFPKELFAESIPMLWRAKAAHKLVGIITSTSRPNFEHDLTFHELPRQLLDYTQTANDTAYHKPDARVFEPASVWLAECGVAFEDAVYIGDSLLDMQAALAAGLGFVGVETGLVTASQFAEHGVQSIPSVGDLLF
jgi:phosphoglycolate phosphatase